MKRTVDVLLSSLSLLLLTPLLCAIALAIKLDSPGPVLFVQERLGRRLRPFRCLKFRTMRDDAERDTGPCWATACDPRITKVGRFLRRTRFDELPQLINILHGEMSIVGPRPIRYSAAQELGALQPPHDIRFSVKPGLTGWAQIALPYPETAEAQCEKFDYDVYYVEHQSIWLDLKIMLMTPTSIVRIGGI
jgi:lipopolysaccharide/colanic/teichoic acid biosynthesis glycosyltransferase